MTGYDTFGDVAETAGRQRQRHHQRLRRRRPAGLPDPARLHPAGRLAGHRRQHHRLRRRRPGHLRKPTRSATSPSTATTSSATRSPARPPRTAASPPPPTTPTASRCRSPARPAPGHQATYDYLGRQAHRDQRRALPASGPPPTPPTTPSDDGDRRDWLSLVDHPGRGDHHLRLRRGRGETARSPTAPATPPRTPTTRSAGRPTVTYPDGTAAPSTGYDAAGNAARPGSWTPPGSTLADHVRDLRRRGRPAVGHRRRSATPPRSPTTRPGW